MDRPRISARMIRSNAVRAERMRYDVRLPGCPRITYFRRNRVIWCGETARDTASAIAKLRAVRGD